MSPQKQLVIPLRFLIFRKICDKMRNLPLVSVCPPGLKARNCGFHRHRRELAAR